MGSGGFARGIEQAVHGPAPAQEFTHATSTYLHHFHGHTTSISRVSFTNPLITLLTVLLPCAQVCGRALPSLKPRQLYDGYATPSTLAAARGGAVILRSKMVCMAYINTAICFNIGVPGIKETPTSEFSDMDKTTTSLYTDVTLISESEF